MPKKDLQWFLDRVDISESDCWNWRGEKTDGYAQMTHQESGIKKRFRVHRMAYDSLVGQIPDGLCVCHHCDNPPCVNPGHLFVGTHWDNAQDRNKKGRTTGRGVGVSGIFGVNRDRGRWVAMVNQVRFGSYQTKIAAAYRFHVEKLKTEAGIGQEEVK